MGHREAPDLPGIPIFHDWGERLKGLSDIRLGQVWMHQSVGGERTVWLIDGVGVDGALNMNRVNDGVLGVVGVLSIDALLTSSWTFLRHPWNAMNVTITAGSDSTTKFVIDEAPVPVVQPAVASERDPEADRFRASLLAPGGLLVEQATPSYWPPR